MRPTTDGCLKFEEELPAYLEGEDRPLVLEHAEGCEFCRCVLADVEMVRGLSLELVLDEPSPVVWANVRAALAAEGIIHPQVSFWRRWLPSGNRRWLRSPAPVIGAVAAVVVAVVLLRGPRPGNPPQISSASSVQPAVAIATNYSPRSTAQAQQTIEQLEQVYDARRGSMEPSLEVTYEKSLQSLDDEIRECQASIQQQPRNVLAGEYLSSAYMEKAQLLQSALEYNLR
ncbi:MAG: hypothetical protein ACRD1J_02310 [Terriglobia bacterium]